ncbi:hypothetical protein QJS66_16920 [Kocuria rhizophila]|nr:hypothetical protein QJS66_16920 [Kocuria rhizophila]
MALNGGYAEVLVGDRCLVPLGDIDPSFGHLLACSGLTSYSAIQKIMPVPADKPVAVMGAGGVGLVTIALLKALGHENIVAVGRRQKALENATPMGATATVVAGRAGTPRGHRRGRRREDHRGDQPGQRRGHLQHRTVRHGQRRHPW